MLETKQQDPALRMKRWVYDALQEKHAATYRQHRLSFRRWIEQYLIEALDLVEPKQ